MRKRPSVKQKEHEITKRPVHGNNCEYYYWVDGQLQTYYCEYIIFHVWYCRDCKRVIKHDGRNGDKIEHEV